MAFLVLQPQHEALDAAVAHRQIGAQVADQPPQREQQRGMAFHLVAQLHPRVEMVGRRIERQRVVGLAVEPVEMLQQRQAEAAAHGIARQRTQVAQVADAHALQALAAVAGQLRAAHRYAVERVGHRARVRQGEPVAQAGEHLRGARRGRQGDAMAEAERIEFLAQPCLDPRPRPQQPEARADLQHDAARPLRADQRAVPVRPRGQEALPARIGLRIVFDQRHLGQQRMRRGQAHAGTQAGVGGRCIYGMQRAQLRRPADQRQWRFRIRPAPEDGIQRQLRQQYAGPEHACASTRTRGGHTRDRRAHGECARRHRGTTALAHVPGDSALPVADRFEPQRCRRRIGRMPAIA